LIILIIIGEEYKLWSSLLCSFSNNHWKLNFARELQCSGHCGKIVTILWNVSSGRISSVWNPFECSWRWLWLHYIHCSSLQISHWSIQNVPKVLPPQQHWPSLVCKLFEEFTGPFHRKALLFPFFNVKIHANVKRIPGKPSELRQPNMPMHYPHVKLNSISHSQWT
jgi:hypothetical protein